MFDISIDIRLEQGGINDAWYSSCADLVESRFFNSDFEAFGVSGMKVNRVFRIHNRFLRSQFEVWEFTLKLAIDFSLESYASTRRPR